MEYKRIETPDGDLLIELQGEMDAQGCARIRPELDQIATKDYAKNVVLDLARVSFLDSSGIGAIVFLYKRLKTRDRHLEIINVQNQPRELIELLRLGSAIPVHFAANQDSPAGIKQCAD